MSETTSTSGPISQTLGTMHRAAEVARVLARFGFGEFLRQSGLDRFRTGKGPEEEAVSREVPLPRRVRLLFEELGPTFIKAGQILSTRPDLIPPEWTSELAKLQSDVPPEPWEGDDGIEATLRAELGDRFETEVERIEEEALAAGSVAQVHRGRLRTGERVVLKVLRPGIREQMSSDLELLRMFGRVAQHYFENLGFDTDAVVDEFVRQLQRETDLLIEAKSVARMRRDFEDTDEIMFPRVHHDLCTRGVLVMEEVEGQLLNQIDLDALTAEERERIVRNGADMVFRQCLVVGFFHADPHPGNIIVREGGRLCFIDCGMTGLIDPDTLSEVAQIVHGAINGDLNLVIKMAIEIGDADPSLANNRTVRADVWRFVDRFHEGTLESIRMGQLLNEFFAILRKHNLRCPSDIVYLIKAITTIEGVGESVAPEFDLVSYVRPYVEDLIRKRYGLRAIRARIEEAVGEYSDLLEDLPTDIKGLLHSLRTNQLALRLDHKGFGRLTQEIERASLNISWAVAIAAIIISASLLILADSVDRESSTLTTVATVAFIAGLILALFRFLPLPWKRKL